jgi:hypothetical protein
MADDLAPARDAMLEALDRAEAILDVESDRVIGVERHRQRRLAGGLRFSVDEDLAHARLRRALLGRQTHAAQPVP